MIISAFKPILTAGTKRALTVSSNGNVRLDSWIEIERRKTLGKISHFGKEVIPGKMVVKDFIFSEIDHQGNVVDFTSSVVGNGLIAGRNCDMKPWNYVDENGTWEESQDLSVFDTPPVINLNETEINIRTTTLVRDNSFLPIEADIFEDDFNAPFALYGMALAAFSVCAMHVPYAAKVIMDSSLGFAVKKIIPLNHIYEIPQQALSNNLLGMTKFLEKINKGFHDLSVKSEVDLRVHAFIHPFGCVVELFHKDFNTLRFRNHVNISDHCRVLRTIEARDRSYLDSPLFTEINKHHYPSAISSLFESHEEKNEFSKGLVVGNYVSDWDKKEARRWQKKLS